MARTRFTTTIWLSKEHKEAGEALSKLLGFVSSESETPKLSPLCHYLIGKEAVARKLPGWRWTKASGFFYQTSTDSGK